MICAADKQVQANLGVCCHSTVVDITRDMNGDRHSTIGRVTGAASPGAQAGQLAVA
jgi:hypothetical protein